MTTRKYIFRLKGLDHKTVKEDIVEVTGESWFNWWNWDVTSHKQLTKYYRDNYQGKIPNTGFEWTAVENHDDFGI